MSNKVIIRIPQILLNEIKSDLKRSHDFAFERIGFVETKYKKLNDGTVIIFLTDYYTVPDKYYVNDPEVGARINSDAIREAMQRVLDYKTGCFHVHYHALSYDIPEFSETDMIDNPEIVKSLSHVGSKQVHGMMVLGNEGINALVKLPDSDTLISATKIVVVGYPMQYNFPGLVKVNPNVQRYDRQLFLGADSQFLINNTKIGVIGLGGGGSHIIQQLAYLGFYHYVLFDYDTVDDTNLNRMVSAGVIDATNEEKKVDVAERIIRHVLPDADIIKIEDKWQNSPANLQECDIVVGGVDSFIERRDLELECRRFLIPHVDIGMDIHNKYDGESPSMAGQVILSMPGDPCMSCLGFLSETNLAREATKYGDTGGKPQVVWSNGMLASNAVGIVVDLVTGWSGQKNIIVYNAFDGNRGIIVPHPRLKYRVEQCTHFNLKNCGPPTFKRI